jgi:hypothetical protein
VRRREQKQAGGLPPEAVRAARRRGEGREFLVREQGALVDTSGGRRRG